MSSCSRHAALLSLALAMVCQSHRFVELQEIPTKGAFDFTAFSMDGTQHLAVANYFDGSSRNIDSKIYKWNDASSTFLEMQSIPTKGARRWTAFSMNGTQHLAMANHFDGSSYNIDSKIYKWSDTSSTFVEIQSIPTRGALDFTAFSMDGTQHLAVANYFDGSSHNIDSKIYKWNDASNTFLEMQNISTKGAHGWAAFSIDGNQHLVVANQNDDSSHNLESKIYEWNDASSTFLEMQSIPTKSALGWTAFSMNGIQHLVVANQYDGTSYNIDSKIYKWNDASSAFLEMQSIPTKGANGWTAFSIDGIQHLVVANALDSTGSWNIDSKVYKWDDASSTFLEMQSVPTKGARDWTAFSMNGIQHLAVPNYFDDVSYTTFSKDVRSWSLAALGGYLVALSVPIFMAKMSGQAGSRPRQSIEEPQTVGSSVEEGTPLAQEGQASPQKLLPNLRLPETFSGARQLIKKSKYVLAVKMLLESGMLYAMEAHQRAMLVGFSAQCGAGILMPVKSWECPSRAETAELPACHALLAANALCEADAEADDGSCVVPQELDNCADFDVYKMEPLACGAIGCKALSHILWIAAVMSFGATIAWNTRFYASSLRRLQPDEGQRLRISFKALFAFLASLLVTTTLVGFAGGSAAVLAMAFLCPLLPVCAWVLAAWLASLPAKGKEAIVNQAAALELPIFNVFVALNLSEKDVEALNDFRVPLNMGLRVVEDIPELIIGLVDLVYFGGSWYAWFGALMSMAMLVFDLLLGALLQCQQSALKIARKTVDTE
ncbi:TSPEAR [Symbiodinium necroappetens]|uniref:TSPEAR protein n=1 Tax=Symbiodinium necroappetens TaxID=1628268 RepID=A0A813CF52_9DINO|nr:TSPEAR [Symbiodinium necroappetens]